MRLIREEKGISRKEALRFIRKLDEQRKKWSQYLFDVDTWNPKLYDLTLGVKNSVDDTVDFICHTVEMGNFRTSPESQRAMEDLVLAADIKAALVDLKPDIEVTGTDGIIHMTTAVPQSKEEQLVHRIKEITNRIQGIKEIKIHTFPSVPYGD